MGISLPTQINKALSNLIWCYWKMKTTHQGHNHIKEGEDTVCMDSVILTFSGAVKPFSFPDKDQKDAQLRGY